MICRRTFLKSLSALGLSSGGFLPILSAKTAPNLPEGNDYKAIVCIYLHGGNDSFNMLLPSNEDNYDEYHAARGGGANPDSSIAVAKNILNIPDLANNKLTVSSNPYLALNNAESGLKGVYDVGLGLNVSGVMPEVAHLLQNHKIKLISNIGNLIEPISQKDFEEDSKEKPVFLFSHDNQRMQVDIGRADLINGFGWAGRIADRWFGSDKYENFPFGMNFSLRAIGSRFLEGTKTRPYNLSQYGTGFSNMRPNDMSRRYNGADEGYNRRSMYTYLFGGSPIDTSKFNYAAPNWNRPELAPVQPLDLSNRSTELSPNFLRRAYQKMGLNSLKTTDAYLAAIAEDLEFDRTDSYGKPLFSVPSDEENLGLETNGFGSLIKNLEVITKMIKVGVSEGYRRQIYLVQLGGFDTHGSQLDVHPTKLRELSMGLDHFNSALENLGLSEQVVSYTTTDFGRTVSSNGDGTDHGWGSHQMIMGGGIDKAEVIGKLPSLVLGGLDDAKNQGRIIPSIATIQMQAELAHWFGVDNEFLAELFPHLSNFQKNPSDITSSFVNLGLKV